MFKNYLITAVRNIKRNKVFSFIKIIGLSIGTAVCILIYLFIADELSFDRFHENSDRLFRVVQVSYDQDTRQETGLQQFIPPAVGPELPDSIPEIRYFSRITNSRGVVRTGDNLFRETLTLADAAFFEMFSFPLIYGDSRTVLLSDHNVVLTRSTAERYFGRENPMGRALTIFHGEIRRDYTVTGVAEDIPGNSSLQFDLVIPFTNLPIAINNPGILENWNRWYCPVFVQLEEGITDERVTEELGRFCDQYYSALRNQYIDQGFAPFTFGLQPITDIRLSRRVAGNAGLTPSYLLAGIAAAILLIACFNFMNLSIGMSSIRSREVGMRKVLGARRKQIIRQFLGEGLISSFLALIVGIVLAEVLLGRFNLLSGKDLTLSTLFGGYHFLALLGLTMFAGLCAGCYPAFVQSAFQPGDILKGKLKVGGKNVLTRGLVVLQFFLSVVLAVTAAILAGQVSFMINRDPGYARDGLVAVLTQEIEQESSERVYSLFKEEIVNRSQIHGVTASNREFGVFLPGSTLETDGEEIHYRFNRVDADFLTTMNIPLRQGRDFSKEAGSDRDAVIVNRSMMDKLGPERGVGDFLGELSKGFPYDRRIIGVMDDCHFETVQREIDPLLIYMGEGASPRRNVFARIFVRVDASNVGGSMDIMKAAWKKVQPDKPFLHVFQDDVLASLYATEKRWSAIIRYASVFSILLACMGVFGLTALTLNRMEKEIGIRKVLGARLEQILILTMKEFLLIVAAANVISWPVIYLVMRRVLLNYAYRIPIGVHYFILAGAASLLVAVLTILYLSLKAALKNPADSLRYE